jgi:hypothetical protein
MHAHNTSDIKAISPYLYMHFLLIICTENN